jgi:hypothetical protein
MKELVSKTKSCVTNNIYLVGMTSGLGWSLIATKYDII